MGEKSFIPEVLQKEAELELVLHAVKEESEQSIGSAEREAQKTVREFEETLPGLVQQHFETEMTRIRADAQRISDAGRLHAEELKKTTVHTLDRAVQKILRDVLPLSLSDEDAAYDNENE